MRIAHTARAPRWRGALAGRLQPLAVRRRALDVVLRDPEVVGDVLGREVADHLPGHAQDERAVGDVLAFGNEGPRADEAVLPDDGAVQDDGADADQRVL